MESHDVDVWVTVLIVFCVSLSIVTITYDYIKYQEETWKEFIKESKLICFWGEGTNRVIKDQYNDWKQDNNKSYLRHLTVLLR